MFETRRTKSSTTTGAKPSDNSSIRSNSGLQTMALPSASIWRSPPDKSPASRNRKRANAGKNWNTSASSRWRSAAPARCGAEQRARNFGRFTYEK